MTDLGAIAAAALRALPPERAHRLTHWLLRRGMSPRTSAAADDPILAARVFGRDFPNPVGIAAGFDKNAEVFDEALSLGIGFVEVGGVTPRPQPGNPKPRLFRLPQDRAIINRLGFNNEGLEAVAARLRKRDRARGIVGVNLGKNKDSPDAAADYAACIAGLAPLVDYLVVNVSSPNTPGLRALQSKAALEAVIGAALDARARATPMAPPPLLLKIAPDVTREDIHDIASVALAYKLDGLIVGNSTITRPSSLKSRHRDEAGGLSGAPLFPRARAVLGEMYRETHDRIPIVGVGGIASGADAYAMVRAGASLIQLYTALVYQGPGLIGRIKAELAAALRRDGFRNLAAAVGADHR